MNPLLAARSFPLELLAPARDADVARAAIDHGADAVYIGGPGFGARAAAGNSLSDIESLANWAHGYHARVYLTLNTILKDEELPLARELAWNAYNAGVDALIVQDMGLLLGDLPPLEIHASTQCDIRTPEKAAFFDGLGMNQIVLARELTLEEIAGCRRAMPRARIEFFIHGALCVSYSGRCYLSCAETGRSANRGECAQPCRLPYRVTDQAGRVLADHKHVLSLKDNDQSENLEALVLAGVTSFKIEGRLKDAAYVKNITAYYRQKLDELIARHADEGWRAESLGHCDFAFTPDPKRTFHRGATDYFVTNRQPEGIAELDTPKSTGETIGRVTELSDRPAVVTVKTAAEIANGDGFVYLDAHDELKGLAVNRAEPGTPGTMRLFLREGLGRHPDLTIGTLLKRNKDRLFAKALASNSARRTIAASLTLQSAADALRLEAAAAGVRVSSEVPFAAQPAKHPEKSRESLVNALSKTGDTAFAVQSISLPDTIPFVPMSIANQLRRDVLTKLREALRQSHRHDLRHRIEPVVAPELSMDFRGNVANAAARRFWSEHGVIAIHPAAEVDPSPLSTTDSLMHTRHCIRRTLHLCPRQTKGDPAAKAKLMALNGGRLKPEPLFLEDDKGRRFIARFDCRACEMHIGWVAAAH